MSTHAIAKKKPLPHRATSRGAGSNGVQQPIPSPTSLLSLIERIAERGRLIPADVQDELSREMRRCDYCIGSGPVGER